jgi:hypothetical protein
MLSVRLSSGEHWQASAGLQVRTGLETTLRSESTAQAPFYLTARLLRGHTEVELTPSGAARPTRFTTLCGTDVASTVASSFGTELSTLFAPSAVPALACARPDGARARLETPMAAKLLEYQAEACAPQPNAAPQFELAVGLVAAWADEPLRGAGAFHGEGADQALRYRVYGKARADKSLAALLPCAATDDSVSVALEGGLRGPAPARPQPLKLTFTFSCEDVKVECTAW